MARGRPENHLFNWESTAEKGREDTYRPGFSGQLRNSNYWVAIQELKLSYHNPETVSVTINPYCGNLN